VKRRETCKRLGGGKFLARGIKASLQRQMAQKNTRQESSSWTEKQRIDLRSYETYGRILREGDVKKHTSRETLKEDTIKKKIYERFQRGGKTGQVKK